MLPPHCNRCFAHFPDDDQRTAHQRAEIPCRLATPPDPSEGIDGERLIRLKNRKGQKNKGEKFKWEMMYQVLFPNEEVPAPWCNFEKLKKTFKESGLPQVDAERFTPMMRDVLHEQLQGIPADLRENLLSKVETSIYIVVKNLGLAPSRPGGDDQAVRHVESIEPCASERMAHVGDDGGDDDDDDDDSNNNDESRNNTDGNSNNNNNDNESQNNTDGNGTNDDNSDESREYCPHIEGRIPYPNADCEMCRGNWEYNQAWLPDYYTAFGHGEE